MTDQVWTQCPVCEGPMNDWQSVGYVDVELLACLADLVGLIDQIAPEYSESPMVSNARILVDKERNK